MKKKIVIFSGVGISADSGLSTFRASDGLWAKYRVEDVCTPQALINNRKGVIDFYNLRRKELLFTQPNTAHRSLLRLLDAYNVEVVTQNVDDLHERAAAEAGAELKVTHLHGELRKLRSSVDENAVVPIEGWEQEYEARHADGSLLRPFVVFFGESVPMIEMGNEIVSQADILVVVGTSLQVYPAAGLVSAAKTGVPVWLVDPEMPDFSIPNPLRHIPLRAEIGMPLLVNRLLADAEAEGEE